MTTPVQFPNPAMVEVSGSITTDDVTDTQETLTKLQPVPNIAAGPGEGGWSVGWDEDDRINGVILTSVTDEGDWVTGTDAEGQQYRFRPLDPYDAVMMSAAGVPQPLSVVQAHVLRGGALADSLDAVVAADNTVATLMLETGMGTFVRYGGDWQLLRDDSGSLDDMNLVSVAPGALNVWDAADGAGQTTPTSRRLPPSRPAGSRSRRSAPRRTWTWASGTPTTTRRPAGTSRSGPGHWRPARGSRRTGTWSPWPWRPLSP
jgi:hypothetical protein